MSNGGVQIVIPGTDYGADHRLRHPADHVAVAGDDLLRAGAALTEEIASRQPSGR